MTNEEAFWEEEGESALVREEPGPGRVYDLEERTACFGEAVIQFSKRIPFTPVNNRLIDQLVGAGTSVGATTARRTKAIHPRISGTGLATAARRPRRANFSCAWSPPPNPR